MSILQTCAKFLLALLSWIPLVWTVVILAAAYGSGYHHASFEPGLRNFLVSFAVLYVRAGFILWLVLLVWLSLQKLISSKRRNFYSVLMLAGVLCAMLALSYDVLV